MFVDWSDSHVEFRLLVQTWCKVGANSIRAIQGFLLYMSVGSSFGLNLQVL